MDTGIKTGEQEPINVFKRMYLLDLGKRQGQEFEERRPSGKRLTDSIHHFELLAAGQNKLSRFFVLINDSLDIGKKVGHPLDLIEDNTAAVPRQEATRVLYSESADIRSLEIGVLQGLENLRVTRNGKNTWSGHTMY